ncbi:bacterial transcriptional activator domain-containing protein [Fodinicola feengrottensis]|uniref:bacterial transcriptional activator domain-containing protein n=1 Tax=Fodinicola feengrottensis TaxID=435914 RepID=UPI0013D15CF3|nr:bacterial transcriptional activator domain-containing protein [Fodinicola feengrottensis]
MGTDKYAIELRNLAVDVEVFLAIAAKAQMEYERGSADAPRALALAEATYSGDFLEEDPYQDWAVPLREEAKARYLELVRLLASIASKAGEYDRAARYRLRALERDTFDEEAHLGLIGALVAAGRHGEAKRRYQISTASRWRRSASTRRRSRSGRSAGPLRLAGKRFFFVLRWTAHSVRSSSLCVNGFYVYGRTWGEITWWHGW